MLQRGEAMNEPELLKGMQGQLVKYPPKFLDLSSQEKKSITMKLSQTFDLAKNHQFLYRVHRDP